MGRVSNIRSGTKKRIEEILRDYPNLEKYIRDRRKELMYPIQDDDENVGGGKSSKVSRPQEQMIITIDEDLRLKALEREKRAVEKVLLGSDSETYMIADRLYFHNSNNDSLDNLINKHEVLCGHTQAFQRRTKLINGIAKELGLYDPY